LSTELVILSSPTILISSQGTETVAYRKAPSGSHRALSLIIPGQYSVSGFDKALFKVHMLDDLKLEEIPNRLTNGIPTNQISTLSCWSGLPTHQMSSAGECVCNPYTIPVYDALTTFIHIYMYKLGPSK
jgi:hypothetical protein